MNLLRRLRLLVRRFRGRPPSYVESARDRAIWHFAEHYLAELAARDDRD